MDLWIESNCREREKKREREKRWENFVGLSPRRNYIGEVNANFSGSGCCVVSATDPYGR
jgi:hypothetical protein